MGTDKSIEYKLGGVNGEMFVESMVRDHEIRNHVRSCEDV